MYDRNNEVSVASYIANKYGAEQLAYTRVLTSHPWVKEALTVSREAFLEVIGMSSLISREYYLRQTLDIQFVYPRTYNANDAKPSVCNVNRGGRTVHSFEDDEFSSVFGAYQLALDKRYPRLARYGAAKAQHSGFGASIGGLHGKVRWEDFNIWAERYGTSGVDNDVKRACNNYTRTLIDSDVPGYSFDQLDMMVHILSLVRLVNTRTYQASEFMELLSGVEDMRDLGPCKIVGAVGFVRKLLLDAGAVAQQHDLILGAVDNIIGGIFSAIDLPSHLVNVRVDIDFPESTAAVQSAPQCLQAVDATPAEEADDVAEVVNFCVLNWSIPAQKLPDSSMTLFRGGKSRAEFDVLFTKNLLKRIREPMSAACLDYEGLSRVLQVGAAAVALEVPGADLSQKEQMYVAAYVLKLASSAYLLTHLDSVHKLRVK